MGDTLAAPLRAALYEKLLCPSVSEQIQERFIILQLMNY